MNFRDYYIEPNRFELQRFFVKVHHVGPKGCWFWRSEAARNGSGRPMFGTRDGSDVSARVAYRWFVGQIPAGHQVDHLCSNPMCVNPAHLEAVTPQENTRRAVARNTHCRNGHPITPDSRWRNGRRNGRESWACKQCLRESRARKAASL